MQEKIISLELTKPPDLDLDSSLNGLNLKDVDEKSTSEPPTPVTEDEKVFGEENLTHVNNRKKKRKRSKKGKN